MKEKEREVVVKKRQTSREKGGVFSMFEALHFLSSRMSSECQKLELISFHFFFEGKVAFMCFLFLRGSDVKQLCQEQSKAKQHQTEITTPKEKHKLSTTPVSKFRD